MFPGLGPLILTTKLAALTTLILIIVGTPVAWWLANTRVKIKPIIEALVALPIVLPPTVLGFYLLLLLSPESTFGNWWLQITGQSLTFSFTGLVFASVISRAMAYISPACRAGTAVQASHLYEPSLQRQRFSKRVTGSPVFDVVAALVNALSSG